MPVERSEGSDPLSHPLTSPHIVAPSAVQGPLQDPTHLVAPLSDQPVSGCGHVLDSAREVQSAHVVLRLRCHQGHLAAVQAEGEGRGESEGG